MISIENLRLTVEGREILKGIDMHLAPGEIYGLLGPNGAGKSTTIFSLLGLRSRQSGRIRVLESDPADNAVAIRRSIGVMPEKSGFYDWMAASDYLEWYGSFYGYESTGRDQETMLEKVGLGKEAHRPIGTYSRGMKQRLAVARALMSRPRLLILDEPTNGLDPKGRHEIHDLLVDFASDKKRGVLLCSHLLDDVDRLCSRIGIIDNGRTRLEGSLTDLLSGQGGGQRYRLRLESEPDTDKLPAGITVLGNQGRWWRIQVQVKPSQELSPLWGELWRRGWKIMEIRSEASSLEQIYMQYTNHKRHDPQEVA